MELYIAAFITGLFGSLHCAGMCGPLVLAFNLRGGSNSWGHALIYNASRVFAYALLGILFGLIGLGFSLAGWQQLLSILTGSFILLFVFGKLFFRRQYQSSRVMQKISGPIKASIQKQLAVRSLRSSFSLGFLNGLLPCGLVYIALAGAVLTGTAWQGSLYMILFGLGNFPLMLLFAASGNYLSVKKRISFKKILPVFSVAIACLLIVRGLNLGIPYLSPKFDQSEKTAVCCDHEH